MKYTKDFEKLGLPNYFKFGIELEAFNVKTKGKNSLYTGKSAEYIKSKNWHMATKNEEVLVGNGGAELVSPILTDSKKNWKDISDICKQIKKYPGKYGDEVVTDSKCGLHIHFDANCLLKDPNKMQNFLKLYAESEELLYKMCNAENDPIRKNAINKDFKGLHIISSLWRNGVAAPTGNKLIKQIENGTLKVSYKNFGKLKMLAGKYKLDERRYCGLNLTNIGNSKKNTIEFRMANGTLNPDVIKQNVFLYASLIDTAINLTENPEIYQNKLDEFYKTQISEKQKAQNFLNLIMQDSNCRQIYMNRWESVKDAKVFQKNSKKGFSQNRFKREQFKSIAEKTPVDRINSTFANIQKFMNRTKIKGDSDYDRCHI
jgi:hypothetical protein